MDAQEAQDCLHELERLVDTLGLEIVDAVLVRVDRPDAGLYLGKGKTDEIVSLTQAQDVDCIVFDVELSPSQQRNWESRCGLRVADRQEIILEIFSNHASSREAAAQVELARLEYMLPRLKRAWTHLSRQKGGARGTREGGETQLEVDRRVVLQRIARLKKELLKLTRTRGTQRKLRQKRTVVSGSIVGYTNTGKSSLMNALTRAGALVEDKLFATLDATTRKLKLPDGQPILLTDTVGLIRKLPHDLVEAFKSTLEEVVHADFLIHVVDASSPQLEQQHSTTLSVLHDLGTDSKPVVTVLNKIDLLTDPLDVDVLRMRFPDGVPMSAKTGKGVEELVSALQKVAARQMSLVEFRIPQGRGDLTSYVYRTGCVFKEEYEDTNVHLTARVPQRTKDRLAAFLV